MGDSNKVGFLSFANLQFSLKAACIPHLDMHPGDRGELFSQCVFIFLFSILLRYGSGLKSQWDPLFLKLSVFLQRNKTKTLWNPRQNLDTLKNFCGFCLSKHDKCSLLGLVLTTFSLFLQLAKPWQFPWRYINLWSDWKKIAAQSYHFERFGIKFCFVFEQNKSPQET